MDFGFDDDTLDDLNTCYATLNMFYELDLHSRFAIEKDVSFRKLCTKVTQCLRNMRFTGMSKHETIMVKIFGKITSGFHQIS